MTPSGGIYDGFRRIAAGTPGRAAVVDGHTGEVTTAGALLERADALAGHLEARGLRRGDPIAVQLPNSADLIALFLASLRIGCAFVPIDRDATESEVARILDDFSISALIDRESFWSPGSLPLFTLRADRDVRRFDVALLKLTSGSTGHPRGILTSEDNLISDCRNICSSMEIHSRDVNLGAIPLSHSYGFSNLVMPLLLQGTALVISNDYVPLSIIELCNRFRCTVVPGIPMMFDFLSQIPDGDGEFETVRTFISAGAPLAPAVSRRFRERFGKPIHTFYGCSECGGITYDRVGAAVERGSCGKPLDGVQVAIGAEGRIAISSRSVARGYVGATEAESVTFEERTFLSDDLASIREDGEIELTGRIGDLINIAGKKVNPREVERVIRRIEGVREVKVYGEPAGARGDVVAAAIVADGAVTREAVRAFCREHLSQHKIPRVIKMIDSMPLDARGKIRKSALAEL